RDFHVTGVQTCALPIWRPLETGEAGGTGLSVAECDMRAVRSQSSNASDARSKPSRNSPGPLTSGVTAVVQSLTLCRSASITAEGRARRSADNACRSDARACSSGRSLQSRSARRPRSAFCPGCSDRKASIAWARRERPRISVPLPSRNVTGPVRVIVIGSFVITVRLRTVPHLLHKRRSILRKYCTVVAPFHEGICAALAGGCDAGASRNRLHGGRRDDRDHRFAPPHQPRAAVARVPPGHV